MNIIRILIVAALVMMSLPLQAARQIDQIVAVVDDDVILRSELNRALRGTPRPAGVSRQKHADQVLEKLITDKALQIAVKNSGVKVTEAEIDEAVAMIAAQNKITVAFLKEVLKEQGQDYGALRKTIAEQLLMRNFQRKMLSNLVKVTDSEIDDYLALYGSAGKSRTVTQIHSRHILRRTGETRSNKAAKMELQEFRSRINAGESFADIARAYSDDTASALNGGDLGWLSPGVATPQFQVVMDRTAVNAISQPFQSPFGWHILEVLGRRKHQGADTAARDAARAKIQQRKIEENIVLLTRRIRQQAYVEKFLDPAE
jgi:peptidyl-prolyl cis-trans isomerase SurA